MKSDQEKNIDDYLFDQVQLLVPLYLGEYTGL